MLLKVLFMPFAMLNLIFGGKKKKKRRKSRGWEFDTDHGDDDSDFL